MDIKQLVSIFLCPETTRGIDMALTKDHKYEDAEGDWVSVEQVDLESYEDNFGAVSFVHTSVGGAYVGPGFAAPLALNVLGHDRPDDDPMAVSVSAEEAVVHIARTPMDRDFQLDHAAALLMAVDAYDKRAIRLATAEKRRQQALDSLANSFAKVNKPATEWTGDDVGKLREALGRYDAALAN